MSKLALHTLTKTDEDLPFCPRTDECIVRKIHHHLHKYEYFEWDKFLSQYYRFMQVWKDESDEEESSMQNESVQL